MPEEDWLQFFAHQRHNPAPTGGMTWRPRCYLALLVMRHLGVGLFCLARPEAFRSTSFNVLKQIAPLTLWGWLLIVVGTGAGVASLTNRERWARVCLVASAATTAAWAAAFFVAAQRGMLDAPTFPITWTALTGKDLIVSGMPFRRPLEEAARRSGLL